MKDKNFGKRETSLRTGKIKWSSYAASAVNELKKIRRQWDCLHTKTEVEENLGNGYFRVKCLDCGFRFTDG